MFNTWLNSITRLSVSPGTEGLHLKYRSKARMDSSLVQDGFLLSVSGITRVFDVLNLIPTYLRSNFQRETIIAIYAVLLVNLFCRV